MGSPLRDRAILLNSLVTLEQRSEAGAVAAEISDALFSDEWHSTHAVSYALLAMARHYGVAAGGDEFTFERRFGERAGPVVSATPVYSERLDSVGTTEESVSVANTGDRPLYVSLVTQGVPAAGSDLASSSGLGLEVEYSDAAGNPVDVTRLTQGVDFVANVIVTNRTRMDLENIALEHRFAAGWEIHNPRMDLGELGVDDDVEYQDIRDDRVHTYFSLDAGQSLTVRSLLNAAYLGSYYLPSVSVEAMYDATTYGRTAGTWVTVADEGP